MHRLFALFTLTLAMLDAMTPDQRTAAIELAGGMLLVAALVLTLVEVARWHTRPVATKPMTEAEWLRIEHGNKHD